MTGTTVEQIREGFHYQLQLMDQASLLSPKSTTGIKVTINNYISTVGKMEAKSIIIKQGKIFGDPNVMSDSFLRFKQRNLELCCTETKKVKVLINSKELFHKSVSNFPLCTRDWDVEPILTPLSQ